MWPDASAWITRRGLEISYSPFRGKIPSNEHDLGLKGRTSSRLISFIVWTSRLMCISETVSVHRVPWFSLPFSTLCVTHCRKYFWQWNVMVFCWFSFSCTWAILSHFLWSNWICFIHNYITISMLFEEWFAIFSLFSDTNSTWKIAHFVIRIFSGKLGNRGIWFFMVSKWGKVWMSVWDSFRLCE